MCDLDQEGARAGSWRVALESTLSEKNSNREREKKIRGLMVKIMVKNKHLSSL